MTYEAKLRELLERFEKEEKAITDQIFGGYFADKSKYAKKEANDRAETLGFYIFDLKDELGCIEKGWKYYGERSWKEEG